MQQKRKRNGTLNHISSAPFFVVVVAVDFCIWCAVSCTFKLDFFRLVCMCVCLCGKMWRLQLGNFSSSILDDSGQTASDGGKHECHKYASQ